MTEFQSITQIAKELKTDYKLTDVEALTIAVQIQRNQILENGLVVSRTDKTPTGLEALAIILGYKQDEDTISINGQVEDIADSLHEIKEYMTKD